MKNFKVTIIVPMYNVEAYIEEAIDSVIGQSIFHEVELIIIDDCSTDLSFQLAEQKSKQYPTNINLFQQSVNRGVSASRNMGLKHASGEYVFFLDSDDVLPSYAIEKMYNAATRSNADLITAPFQHLIDGELVPLKMMKISPLSKEGFINLEEEPQILYSIWSCGKLYKKSLLRGLRYPEDINFGEDQPFTITSMLRAKKIYNVADATYYVRPRPGSITRSGQSTKAIKSSIQVWRIVEKRIDSSSVDDKEGLKVFYFNSCLMRDIWGPVRQVLYGNNLSERQLTLSAFLNWVTELSNTYINISIDNFKSIFGEIGEVFGDLDTQSQQLLIALLKTVKSNIGTRTIT
ncbi:glycosyltransferase family 2 protein [Terribacillus sp. 179-K 1B1 HS]|uniref:glycosyltransferase family 2 protein n=1 Tax=Terribacillus sp. 179-K 1B1 HS TaxID=3142388 RepID=UPI0039A36F94